MSKKFVFPEIKPVKSMPITSTSGSASLSTVDTEEVETRKQQLIKIANNSWGANLWSYAVTSQQLDFTDYENGVYIVGVASFVRVQLSNGIFREDMGYATMDAKQRGLAIYRARKCSITNALTEIFYGFGLEISDLIPQVSISIPELKENARRSTSPGISRSIKISKTDNTSDVTNKPLSKIDSTNLKTLTTEKSPYDTSPILMNDTVTRPIISRIPKENIRLSADKFETKNTRIDGLMPKLHVNERALKPEPLAPMLPGAAPRSDTFIAKTTSTPKGLETALSKDMSNLINDEELQLTPGSAARAERLRKQKQRQEEFKRQLLEKNKSSHK